MPIVLGQYRTSLRLNKTDFYISKSETIPKSCALVPAHFSWGRRALSADRWPTMENKLRAHPDRTFHCATVEWDRVVVGCPDMQITYVRKFFSPTYVTDRRRKKNRPDRINIDKTSCLLFLCTSTSRTHGLTIIRGKYGVVTGLFAYCEMCFLLSMLFGWLKDLGSKFPSRVLR